MCRVRSSKGVLSIFIVLFLAGIFKIGIASAQRAGKIPLLHFGHISGEDPAIIHIKYSPLLDFISTQIGTPIVLVQKASYEKFREAFIAGEVDVGILNCFSYLQLSKQIPITPICRRVVNNMSTYKSYLIVRRESPIRSYQDLKGTVVAFSDPDSTTGYLLPLLMLMQNGVNPEQDLGRIIFVGKHDSCTYAVLNWTADIAGVGSHLFDVADAGIKNRIRILDQSIPVPLGPLAVRDDLPEALRERIKTAFLDLHKTEAGRQALRTAEVTRFENTSDADFESVRELMAPFLE